MGNDVCKKSLDAMTKKEDFEKQLLDGMIKLDEISPPGSKAIVVGLVDGRILWNEMSERQHPLGTKYKNVYGFLSCTNSNPCATWLTSNSTTRDAASRHAAILSNAAENIVRQLQGRLKNVEAKYYDFNIGLRSVIEDFRRRGLSPHVLIEAIDGFHASVNVAAPLSVDYLWQILAESNWIPSENRYNAEIARIFGDQGGH